MPFGFFKESDHPRGKGGKFASKGGGGASESSETAQQTAPEKGTPKVPGARPKVIAGRQKVAKPANHGHRNTNQIAGVNKKDFENQKFYADPSKNGWEKRAAKNTGKIAKARGAAMRQMLKHPSDFVNGKYDWLWAEGTENTSGESSAHNAPKKPQKAPQSVSAQGRKVVKPNTQNAPQPTQKPKQRTQKKEEPLNAKQEKIKAQQELLSAKHRELGMKAAAESQKKHPNKGKLKRLQAKQKKMGQEANKLKTKQLVEKANIAKKQAKAAPKSDLKTRLAANTAQQKAIGSRLAVEQAKKHPNSLMVSHLNRQSARLANQSKKLNRKGSKAAVMNAKQKVKAAKKAMKKPTHDGAFCFAGIPLTDSQAKMIRLINETGTQDGGAGSGNWGHKGRPGKKGGSGKGGGKHYRVEKQGGGYEHKTLTDPTEMAGKYKNQGITGLARSGHGQQYKPDTFKPKNNPKAPLEQPKGVCRLDKQSKPAEAVRSTLFADVKRITNNLNTIASGESPYGGKNKDYAINDLLWDANKLMKTIKPGLSKKEAEAIDQGFIDEYSDLGGRDYLLGLKRNDYTAYSLAYSRYALKTAANYLATNTSAGSYEKIGKADDRFYQENMGRSTSPQPELIDGQQSNPKASKYADRLNKIDPLAVYQAESAKDLWMNDPESCAGLNMEELEQFFNEAKEQQKKSGYKPEIVDNGRYKPYYKPVHTGDKSDMPTKVNESPKASDIKFNFVRGKSFSAEAGQDGVVQINLDKIDQIGDHVLSHEFGHQISAHNPQFGMMIFSNPGGLFGEYVHFTDGTSGFINGPSYNPQESFADAFAMYHSKDNSVMKEHFPDAFDYMDKFVKENPEVEKQLQEYLKNAHNAIDEKKQMYKGR